MRCARSDSRRWLASVFMVSLALCLMGRADDTAASEVRAGASKEVLQLPSGVPLAGYGRRRGKPSTGVHDPVSVRALVLEKDGATIALVSSDLLIIDETLCEAVHRQLAAEGLSGVHVILAATHTHSGPGAYGTRFFEKISMGHFNRAVFDEIVRAVTQAIHRAHESLAPVRVAYATSLTEGLVKNRVIADGPLRRELTVCAFYHAGAEPFAVIVNFSAHPTTLGAWNRALSADYPGVVMREVERAFPSATCLFFAGAVGDQAPVKQGSGFDTAEHLGGALAQRVMPLLEGLHAEVPTTLAAFEEHYRLPPAQLRAGRWVVPRWLGARLVDDDATLSLVSVGDLLFVGVPCDLAAELGETLQTAATSRGFHPVIVGFANDYVGYCVPRALYEQKKYESSMAFNGPMAGELVVQRLMAMMDQLPGDQVTR